MNYNTIFYFLGMCIKIAQNYLLSIRKQTHNLGVMSTSIIHRTLSMTIVKKHNLEQRIRNIKSSETFSHLEKIRFFESHSHLKNKKMIAISPGGYKGFYVMGICKYIKDHYHLDDFYFTGASAGAWNALMLCYRGNASIIQSVILDTCNKPLNTIIELETKLKHAILESFDSDEFDFSRLFIGVTTVDNYKSDTTIFGGFENLDNALDGCIASSHIPFVSGGLLHTYQGIISFDGGFGNYPYLIFEKPVLHITPRLWRKNTNTMNPISAYTTLWSKDNYNFTELFEQGYADAREHKQELDNALLHVVDTSLTDSL